MATDPQSVQQSALSRTEELPWPSPFRAWYLTIVAFLAYTVAMVDRQIITLMVGPMKRDLHLTDQQIGLLLGLAFALSYGLCAIPFGYLADRGSRRRVLALGLTLWSAATVACGFGKGVLTIGLARLGIGMGESVVGPTTLPMVSESFPPHRRSIPMAICISGAAVGGALAYPIGGFMLAVTADMPSQHLPIIGVFHPWQLTFLVAGAMGFVVLLLLMFVKEPPRRTVRKKPLIFREALTHFYQRPLAYAAVLVAPSINAVCGLAFVAWIPAFLLRTYGLGYAEIGVLLGSVALPAGLLGSALAGVVGHFSARLSRSGSAMTLLILMMAVDAIFYIGAVMSPSIFLCIALFGLGRIVTVAITNLALMLLQNMTPSDYRSQATAVMSVLYSGVGLGLGPFIVGTLTTHFLGDQGLGQAMALTAAVAVPIAIAVAIWGRRSFVVETERVAALEKALG